MVQDKGKAKVKMVMLVTPELKEKITTKARALGMGANNYIAFVMHNHFKQEERFEPMMNKLLDQLPAEIGKALKEEAAEQMNLLIQSKQKGEEV